MLNYLRFINISVITCVFFIFITTNVYSSDPYSHIRNLGFQKTNSTPIDFRLQDLNGANISLSDFRGKWILINFWATWCGPCRIEMPTLESLHQEFKDENFVILGVSVDQGMSKQVDKFIKRNEITFPILRDHTGKVSQQYQASSIPSLYLISPDWKLVGIFRGGKSWESNYIVSQFRSLIEFKEVKGEGNASSGGDQLEIPSDLIPPTLDLKLLNEENKVGKEFTMQVLVHWPEEGPKYIVKVPKITFPENVEVGNISSSTSSTSGRSVLIYNYPVKIQEEGKYFIGPITLSFRSFSGGQEQFSRHPGMELDILGGVAYFYWGIAALVFTVLVILFVYFLRKEKGSINLNKEGETPQWESELSDLKKLRFDGRVEDYTIGILNLNKKLAEHNKSEDKNWDQLIHLVKFGGKIITEQEMRSYEKNIETIYREEE